MSESAPARGRRRRTPLSELYADWPYVPPATVDPIHRKCLVFVLTLEAVIEELTQDGWVTSSRDFARKVGINHAGLGRLLAGQTWPDGETIARLEVMTGRSLWPQHDRKANDEIPPFSRHLEGC